MAHGPDKRKKAQALREAGKSFESIEKQLKVTKKTLIKWADEEEWEKGKLTPEILRREQQAALAEAEKAGITKAKYLIELGLVGFSDMANHVEVNPNSGATRPLGWEEMNEKLPGASRVVKKIKERRVTRKDKDGKPIEEVLVEYEFHDKLGALNQIGTALGFKTPEQENANPLMLILERARARHNT
jgi:hypothetical protein